MLLNFLFFIFFLFTSWIADGIIKWIELITELGYGVSAIKPEVTKNQIKKLNKKKIATDRNEIT